MPHHISNLLLFWENKLLKAGVFGKLSSGHSTEELHWDMIWDKEVKRHEEVSWDLNNQSLDSKCLLFYFLSFLDGDKIVLTEELLDSRVSVAPSFLWHVLIITSQVSTVH